MSLGTYIMIGIAFIAFGFFSFEKGREYERGNASRGQSPSQSKKKK